MITVYTCRFCEIAASQTAQTGLEFPCDQHGVDRQTKTVPFRGYTAGCPTCDEAASLGTRPFIRHDNCTSPGSPGHSTTGHCTADACY